MSDTKTVSSPMLVATSGFITQLRNFALNTQLEFTQDEQQRVMNAIRVIDPLLKSGGLDWNYFSTPERRNNVVSVLQQVAYLKVNPSATPRECFFILRNKQVKDSKGVVSYEKEIEFSLEGAGNDTVLRNFGVNVKDVKSYIVYEGDEFTGVIFDGFDEKLPVFKPKMRSVGESKGKALYAVYLIRKNDGRVETAIAEREDVKQSLLAHIRQNGADEDRIRELGKHSLDDLLTKSEFVNGKIKKYKYNQQTKKNDIPYDVDLIGLAWTSEISREKMIERKMRNHAIRRYPKNFSNSAVNELYEQTFAEERYANGKPIIEVEHTDLIGTTEHNFDEEANKQEIIGGSDLNTSEDFVVTKEDVINPQTGEVTTDSIDEDTVDKFLEEEARKIKEAENTTTAPNNNNDEGWM